jgi:hypothetical protein
MAAIPARFQDRTKTVAIAREIAINHKSVDEILKEYEVSPEEWEQMQEDPDFVRILQSEIVAWQSAQNTAERTRLKAAAMIEEWLVEANARLHDKNENLPAKVELAKLIERIAGISAKNSGEDAGGGFRVTINIGPGQQLQFEKDVTPKVIERRAE